MPKPGTYSRKSLSSKEWHKELLLSWIFQTCFKLQASLDRRFLRFGMTLQEGSVLIRCVEAKRITPGQLAIALGRDKGKITRFIDRLAASHLVIREINRRDRRFSILKPTAKGKRMARDLASVFDNIRKELFVGILESDVCRLGKVLPLLHKNAVRTGSRQKCNAVRGRRRIGSHGMKTELARIREPRLSETILTAFPNEQAATTVPVEPEGHENELIRHEQSSEENTTPEKPVEVAGVLVSK